MIKCSLFVFIFTFVQNFKPKKKKKRLIPTCVFECFQSHCHILEKAHEFLHMMCAITIFGERKDFGYWIPGTYIQLSADFCEL
jgi:hypothetical protein